MNEYEEKWYIKLLKKYLLPGLPEEPEEITATALQQEYTNGFLAGQKKAYDECDKIARELSNIKCGCSTWLDEHDAKVRADGYNQALEDFVENISLPMTEEQIGEIVERLKR